MVRYVALISLVFGLGMVGLFRVPFCHEPPAYSRFALNPVEMERTARKLDNQIQARERFVVIQDGIVEQLLRRELSLIQACDRIYEAAHSNYPNFLRYLGNDERFRLKERLARNLVGSLVLEAVENSLCGERVSQLERELSTSVFLEWCRQPWPEENRYSPFRSSAVRPPGRAAKRADGPS